MEIQLRPATPADVPTLRAFESQLVAHERSVVPTLKQEGVLEYYDIPALIADEEKSIVLLAEVNGIPVGCGLGQIRANDACYTEAHFGYIGLMYVSPEQRGKGIVQKIIDRLKAWFESKGISEIHLKVFANNPMAIRAYEKCGFEPLIHEMRLRR